MTMMGVTGVLSRIQQLQGQLGLDPLSRTAPPSPARSP
jgi:hypothetical protein